MTRITRPAPAADPTPVQSSVACVVRPRSGLECRGWRQVGCARWQLGARAEAAAAVPRPAAVLGQEQGKADVSQGRPTVGWVTERFRVELEADQFDELCRPSQPLAGVLELIWNGLDAEADQVTVAVSRTDLDGVDSIKVIDNGHGMTHDDAVRDFRKLGGSWKKGRSLSLNQKRSLHGKKGQGRFRAFALGGSATWESVAEGMSGLERTTIAATLANSEFVVEGPEELATGSLGTMVTIDNPPRGGWSPPGGPSPRSPSDPACRLSVEVPTCFASWSMVRHWTHRPFSRTRSVSNLIPDLVARMEPR